MNENNHGFAKVLLAVGGLVLAGWLVVTIISHLIMVLLYVALGAVVVGGVMILYGKAKRSVTSGNYKRRIGR